MITEVREHAEILREIKDILEITQFDSNELQELCDNLTDDDFNVELDGAEYRFIADGVIEAIFEESVRELIEDCYGLDDMPSIISCHLDWDGIVRDCMVDGYGLHFSSYDGSELEVTGYYIFRIN